MGIKVVLVRLWVIAVCVAATALLAACGSSGGQQSNPSDLPDPLTVMIPPSTLDASLPAEPVIFQLAIDRTTAGGLWRVAAAQGYFGREGLSARIQQLPRLDQISTALAAEAIDGAVVSTDQALLLAEQGLPIHIVLLLTSSTDGAVILARSDVHDIPGLIGKRIAYRPESGGELLLRVALREGNVVPAAVQRIPTELVDPGDLLVRGTVDAAVVSGAEAIRVQKIDPTLETLYTAGDLPGLLSQVLVVRDSVAQNRPGQMLALVRTWQSLYQLNNQQFEFVVRDLAALQKSSPEQVAVELSGVMIYDVAANAVGLLPGGEYYDTTIRTIRTVANEAGVIRGTIDPQSLIDGSFAQAVASAR